MMSLRCNAPKLDAFFFQAPFADEGIRNSSAEPLKVCSIDSIEKFVCLRSVIPCVTARRRLYLKK